MSKETLRGQIREIAARTVNPAFAAGAFPSVVASLATNAFMEKWPEDSVDTVALRRACELMTSPGWISDDYPAIGKEGCAEPSGEVTHACPQKGSEIMPCCGKTPFEALNDRMTCDPTLVTCRAHKPAPSGDED